MASMFACRLRARKTKSFKMQACSEGQPWCMTGGKERIEERIGEIILGNSSFSCNA